MLYRLILFILYISFSLSLENQILVYDSEIIITIKGKGNQPILNNKTQELVSGSNKKNLSFEIKPSEILVNDKKIDKIDYYVYNLTEEENIIKITFNETITNCNVMFYNLTNIIKINFSNFDSSQVIKLDNMFYNCSNLISLDLSNFNTSSVVYMNDIFHGCSSLVSLDLSNFNTSSIVYMNGMFYGCSNIITLDLSNFNTSSVRKIEKMFYGCNNLISLDLSNFDTSSVNNMNSMFNGCNNNLIYCINKITDKINSLINKINEYTFKDNNNCSDICFYKYKKIILDTHACVLNCSNKYKYEYNNICYEICPNDTHNTTDNICVKDDYEIINNNIYNNKSSTYIINFLTQINTNNLNIVQESTIDKSNFIISYSDNNYIDISEIYKLDYVEYFNNKYISKDKDDIILNIRNEIKNNILYIKNIIEKEKKDIIIKEDNIIYQITSPINQNNNEYNNITSKI